MKSLTIEEFIEKARIKHGSEYSYIEKYTNFDTPIDIECNTCGIVFNMKPRTHLNDRGKCPFCYPGGRPNKAVFLKKASLVHERDHYNYDYFVYVDTKTKGNIFCNKHKEFFPCSPHNHADGKQNCPKCGRERTTESLKKPIDGFIKKCLEVHGNTYEYDLDSYTERAQKMKIKCRKHGWFNQSPKNHAYNKQGCPKCRLSRGEKIIRKIFTELCINFEGQRKFNECRNINKLPFDFSVLNKKEKLKGLIEFHGRQHFMAVKQFGGVKGFEEINRNDQIKSDFCDFNNIPFLVIPYYNIGKTSYFVEHFLKTIKNKKPITEFSKPIQKNIFQI